MRRPGAGAELEVAVGALGSGGDGIAESEAGRIYLPGTLPGERWRVRLVGALGEGWRGEPLACLTPAQRAEPVCPHFGACGGCRLQHLLEGPYVAFKRRRIVDALARRGLATTVVGEPKVAPLGSRRRVRLGIARSDGKLVLGLRRRGSHRLEPLTACPVAEPALAATLQPLARALDEVLARPWPAEASLTLAANGLDLLLHGARPPTTTERRSLPRLADDLDVARIGWDMGERGMLEPLVVRRLPVVELAGVPIELPIGAFLQATRFGEACLGEAVAGLGEGSRHAVDLFAGLGTLTFPLARRVRRVRAFESDPAAIAALKRAAGGSGLGHVVATVRDLERRPLMLPELAGCDLVVLDPPRAGAAAQAAILARSAVPRLIYASCQPESFARDARLLVDGGFDLVELQPIDQFRFSAEVELIALFARQKRS